MALEGADCLPLYRVAWHESFLAQEGNHLLCRFSAPDTESVRMVARDARAREVVAWAGSVHDSGRTGEANVIVERRFDQPIAVADLQALEDAAAWCLEMHRVTFLRTFCTADRKRMLCIYSAPDAESVRLAQQKAKMPVERVWACRRYCAADLAG